MSKLEQALILDPPVELHFRGPYDDVITSYLKLTNPTDQNICFKLKTTAPKTYCVRPNTGIIQPSKTISVAVMLQPADFEASDKSKHKFMVQSIYAPGQDLDSASLDNLWRDTPSDQFMNSKLKCVFDWQISSKQSANAEVAAPEKDPKQEKIGTPEISGDAQPTQSKDSEANRLENENNRLRQILNELRSENSQLKEEGLRWRVIGSGSRTVESRSVLAQERLISPVHYGTGSSFFSMKNIVLMLVVLAIGVAIGTYQKV